MSAGRPGRNCKNEKDEEDQQAGQATGDHLSWGLWPTLPVGIPGLELPQDWYARRLNRTNRESGCLSCKSFLLFTPKVQAMLDTVDSKLCP